SGLVDAIALDGAEEGMAIVCLQVIVKLALGWLEFTIERLLKAFGQITCDLVLGAAEDERAQCSGKQATAFVVMVARGLASHCKHQGGAEHPGIEEFEKTPQIAQVVLNGCAAQGQAVLAPEKACRLGRLAGRILD